MHKKHYSQRELDANLEHLVGMDFTLWHKTAIELFAHLVPFWGSDFAEETIPNLIIWSEYADNGWDPVDAAVDLAAKVKKLDAAA